MRRYFDADTVGLDYKGMVEDIEAAPEGSIIVLHGEQVPDQYVLFEAYMNACMHASCLRLRRVG